MVYVCDKLLPLNTWNMLANETANNQMQLRLLKVFAEMCSFTDVLENATQRINNVFDVLRVNIISILIILFKKGLLLMLEYILFFLKEYMPLPSLKDADIGSETPSFQFSHAECLLYALHSLGKKHPDSLSFVNDSEKLKDFRARLQYLARGTQG